MSLAPSDRLGPYEITAAIGAGGMGEVFRARDTKLNRDVAIKVLPAAFADDPERLARFTREAQTLASLNHPNIAAIYGIEEVPAGEGANRGSRALVMELVEGEDLSAHMARGPIPIAEALPIARQIAEALEAAHEQGIVHRDLKPANIKVRSDGTVKVLDFGLAKAMDPAGASSSNPNVSHSPTLTHQGTSAGMIIGTAAYMSPEQAKGKPVDKRADIWAFGVVLYEMLTGKRAFRGEDVSETLAAVLMTSPSMDALPATTPPRLKRLIERCLDRDLKSRLRDIGEARVKIARIESGAPEPLTPAASPGMSATVSRGWLITAGALALALLGTLVAWAPWRTPSPPMPQKLLVSIGADVGFALNSMIRGTAAVLSPDGGTLVVVGARGAQSLLFARKLDDLQAVALEGTEGAESPFFSPDGKWVAFFAAGKLKKTSVAGGTPVTVADAPTFRGGVWLSDDTIIFVPNRLERLKRVSSSGGAVSDFGTPLTGSATPRWPDVLPGEKTIIYTEQPDPFSSEGMRILAAPISGGPPKVLVPDGYYARYVSSGHLLYTVQGTLFAAAFDPERLEFLGRPTPVIESLAGATTAGSSQFSVSASGTLVYIPGNLGSAPVSLVSWVTRDGKVAPMITRRIDWRDASFSPDGKRLALEVFDGKSGIDIWTYDIARDSLVQLTFGQGAGSHMNRLPVWSPDGKKIAFTSNRDRPGGLNLYWTNADGSGDIARLTDSPNRQGPFSWHPSGKFLAFHEEVPVSGTDPGPGRGLTLRGGEVVQEDLMILPMEGDQAHGLTPGKPTGFLHSPAREATPMFSPDGRWIAYSSNELGEYEIFVRPFPPRPGSPRRVSIGSPGGGAMFPSWSMTAKELLFRQSNKIMFAPYVVEGDSFTPGTPDVWAPAAIRPLASASLNNYALHPDGQRVAAATLDSGTLPSEARARSCTSLISRSISAGSRR